MSKVEERLSALLYAHAEWCDSIARYEPNKGGQHCGMPSQLQSMAGKHPSVRIEFRRHADYILETLSEIESGNE